jgi:hypothetical protein
MQFVRRCYFVLIFSLALGLFSGEFPESSTLTDDVSNDFVEVSFALISRRIEFASAGSMPSERRISLAEETVQNLTVSLAIDPVLLSDSDLLRSLSIQRR